MKNESENSFNLKQQEDLFTNYINEWKHMMSFLKWTFEINIQNFEIHFKRT